jgi:hypothetical protein
MIDM